MVKWQFLFEVDGIHLSQDKVSVSERIELERIDEYQSRAYVIIDVDQKETEIVIASYKPAWQLLEDFLSVYLVATGMSARIVRELGGSQIPGTGGRGASVSPILTFPVRPTISESDSVKMIEQAKKDFKIFSDAEESLKLAIRYFHRAAETERLEDKIILCFICLDALYIETQTELGYRLCQRVALMLGLSQNERHEVFQKMGELYRKRGSIVHGGLTSLSDKEIHALMVYVQRSIHAFLELKALGKNKKDVLALLNLAWESGRSIDELKSY